MKILRTIFFDRYGDVRAGWRMLCFVAASALVLFPALPVVSLIPSAVRPFAESTVILAALVLASFLAVRTFNRKPFSAIGLSLRPRAGRDLGLGVFLGGLMMAGVFLVELGMGYVSFSSREMGAIDVLSLLVGATALFAVAALIEEVLFRGYLFQTTMQVVTFLPATVLFSTLFAAAHLRNPAVGPLAYVNIGLAGVWLSFAYLKTRRLWLPWGLHFGWNFTQTTVFSFPTSGLSMNERQLFTLVQSGPDWITGGAFGPEGGILCTIALLAGTAAVLKSDLFNVPPGIVTLDSLEDILPPESSGGSQPQ